MTRNIILLIILLGFISCNSKNTLDNPAVAKVDNSYLYLNKIRELIPNNSSKEDSIIIAQNYIHQWIKKQLLVSRAELNLSSEDQDVEEMVEDYRSSLIIHKYQQHLIEQKLDTIVSHAEIDKYYRDYPSNFLLNRNIVKAVYIKIPKPLPQAKKIKQIYKLKKDEDWDKLEDYCFQNATKFDNFSEQWIYSQILLSQTPIKVGDEENFLRRNKYFEAEDSTFHYLINIQDYKLKKEIAPLSFVNQDIRKIIINKRKIQFIKNMEESIFRDAESKNKFKIY
ncbi:hypothetical protein DWB61_16395 [Ancylomarina euxinus]|uniref:Peptidyl-prolyl cis-trans isomerase n=1 Tax=Ancylomarina euxinus TaxID=2283627 RepID=A0A425XX16_9BACT|nr:hypothetical protein [Ancylomarina euxinus]MCZ4696243.1 hypothetical protein [Ancylomarina euxinus]MUP16618.1 hypothetical protein [Ancylomarina euxinus]RRG19179.1 hypothetical protein DWB61_16395 [Ancylomarina euxinus]